MSFDILLKEVSGFSDFVSRSKQSDADLIQIRDDFNVKVNSACQIPENIRKDNILARGASDVQKNISNLIEASTQAWVDSQPMRKLSEDFDDKIVFLVFGKVNAGKSTFCNFIASLFPEDQRRFFRVQDGEVVDSESGFKEGVTETTAAIQGVELGGNLILLDSPGLHSVTEENGQLTKRFTDAADAVLWLTPSTSPGQVAELDELSHELKNGKPLLPVITASDIREEDEVDGELVDCYVNKPTHIREDQQRDVLNRSKQKLNMMGATAALENPISISVFMYRKQDSSAQGIIDSGLATLTREMAVLIQRAAEYKKSKVRQQTLNYLNDHVLQVVDTGLLPVVQDYSEVISDCRIQADRAVNDTIAMIKHSLGILVPKWAEEYKDSKNAEEVARLVNNEFHQIITRELTKIVSDFSDGVKTIHQAFPADGLADFQDISIEYDEVTGKAWAASAGVAGGAAGAAIGSLIFPGVGTVVGGILGGLLGSAAGGYLIETKRVSTVVGVDSAAFVKDVLDQVAVKAEKLVPDVFSQWFEAIDAMQASVDMIRDEIRSLEESIKNIKVKD